MPYSKPWGSILGSTLVCCQQVGKAGQDAALTLWSWQVELHPLRLHNSPHTLVLGTLSHAMLDRHTGMWMWS